MKAITSLTLLMTVQDWSLNLTKVNPRQNKYKCVSMVDCVVMLSLYRPIGIKR